ncbi:hypothetical protein [Cesiribacter sp. SM1]|uniref:hypothetical protein n=1 Tax=Cesiribacter sp. SM1 TaxID=2861196 RepID=UPI001CD58506|nr:hypothetical protein [Cesiribacter sp. SM1]
MSLRTIAGALIGLFLVLLLYAKLADLAGGVEAPGKGTGSEKTSTELADSAGKAAEAGADLPGKEVAEAGAGLPPESPSVWDMIPAWLLVSLGMLLVGGGGYYGMQEVNQKIEERGSIDKDPKFLEDMLRGYADIISEMLVTPRQIKRFSSKIRLQHNLMQNIALEQKTRPGGGGFQFNQQEQLLSFMYLLIIEQDRETVQQLVYCTKEEFAGRLKDIALHKFDYKRFLNQDRSTEANGALSLFLAAQQDEALIKQLCRLNLGSLV